MNFTSKIAVVIGIIGTLFISSCLKPEEYPFEPILSDPIFVANSDSTGVLTVTFTDGDGDIGLNDGDTLDPFLPETYFYHNFHLDYYEFMDGEWVVGRVGINNFPTQDPITFPFRLENITPKGKNKALKGEIVVTIEPRYFNANSASSDSIKYGVTLIDRALNISNTVETDLILR